MARIRTVKPEFFTDATLGECSPTARLLLVGTLVFADDYGNLERAAKQIKAQVFPHDSLDCEPLIIELIEHGLLVEYESSGKKYLHIKGFNKHQKIDKKSSPRHPLYEDSSSPQRGADEQTALDLEGNGKGREGKGSKAERGTRFAPEPQCPQAWIELCKEMRPDLNPQGTYEAFSDYWVARPGQHALKLDWTATWRNWLRKEKPGPRSRAAENLREGPTDYGSTGRL